MGQAGSRPVSPATYNAPEWRAAIEALMLVAEYGGPTMMERIGIMRALYRHEGIRGANAAPETGEGVYRQSRLRPRVFSFPRAQIARQLINRTDDIGDSIEQTLKDSG